MTSTEYSRPHRQAAFTEGQATPSGSRGYQPMPHRSSSSTHHVPITPGEKNVPAPTATLYAPDGDAFNVNPNAPYLEGGGIRPDAGQAPLPAKRDGKRFVGGFAALVKKAMRGQQSSPRPRTILPTTAPSPNHNYTYPRPMTVASFDGSARATPAPAAPSPSTSSDTAYETQETYETHDGDSTAVDHEVLPVGHVGSPVYIEPPLGSDYAKMSSPPSTVGSFSSYLSRIHKFFHDINDLPWVAERVTVDYVPGQSKRRRAPMRTASNRPVISWYGGHPHMLNHNPIDLFSDSSSSHFSQQHPTVVFRVQRPGEDNTNIPYAALLSTVTTAPPPPAPPFAPTPAYGPASQLPHNAPPAPTPGPPPEPPIPTPRGPLLRPIPIPGYRSRSHGGTRYPNGYVPPQQQDAVAAQFPDLSVHHLGYMPNATATPGPPVGGAGLPPSRPPSVRA
ncbi:hypothetical protein Hypma_012820 [Hypsizygus marmoreus]|uniref:Uncharacterized protein n=1 Tax=Hypsizygus marmoreus TaxID=39966 RepID=A0A369JCQ2_HYPMA|nr:hypothetical protein Hypma_012820 [Hypsizygus marmoreus]